MVHGTYRIGDTRFGMRSTGRAFGRWADDALAMYRVRGRERAMYSVVVGGSDGDRRRGSTAYHLLYQGTSAIVKTTSLATLAHALQAELASMLAPQRDDAAYLRAGIVRSDHSVGLVPAWVVASLASLGRRLDREGLVLGGELGVAVDPASGAVIPSRARLRVAPGLLERIGPLPDADAGRFVGEKLPIDRVFVHHPEHVGEVSRGYALHQLASATTNLGRAGGVALEATRALLGGAQPFAIAPGRSRDLLAAVAEGMRS